MEAEAEAQSCLLLLLLLLSLDFKILLPLLLLLDFKISLPLPLPCLNIGLHPLPHPLLHLCFVVPPVSFALVRACLSRQKKQRSEKDYRDIRSLARGKHSARIASRVSI